MKKLGRILFVVLSVLGLIVAGAVCLIIFLLSFQTNDRDNRNSNKSEMIRCTLDWGRLAPFPVTVKDFDIHTEGNSFTRTFRGSFSDTSENIQKWLNSSLGVSEGTKDQDGTIILKTGEGASYGQITVSPDGTHVVFRVSWS